MLIPFAIVLASLLAFAPRPPSADALDLLVRQLRYEELEARLASTPVGSDHDYFAGILANREGRPAESIRLLEQTLPQIQTQNPARMAIALETLADDYFKDCRYAEAIGAYENLFNNFSKQIDKSDLQSLKDDYSTVKLLKNAPAQTISIDGPVRVPTHRSTIDSIDTELTVNGVTASWILDTGANISTVSASFARRLGLQPSTEQARTQGSTGAENRVRVAILPEMRLGAATVHNIVLLVLDDKNLDVTIGPGKHYKIDAIVGYPVFQALGVLTFSTNGELAAGAAANHAGTGARLFMNKLTPLLECGVNGRPLLFSFDTGANGSEFSARYYREFPWALRSSERKPFAFGGAGGAKRINTYVLPEVILTIDGASAALKNVPVIPVPIEPDIDKVYGNLGRDLIAGFRSFTVDFANMRFSLGPKVAQTN
jgi:tetratricopeptide (TPR) repeat protein